MRPSKVGPAFGMTKVARRRKSLRLQGPGAGRSLPSCVVSGDIAIMLANDCRDRSWMGTSEVLSACVDGASGTRSVGFCKFAEARMATLKGEVAPESLMVLVKSANVVFT